MAADEAVELSANGGLPAGEGAAATTAAPLIQLPILPLKNSVLFPLQMMPLAVGRPASVAAVEAAISTEDKTIAIISQRDAQVDDPNYGDLFRIGTRAVIKKMARQDQTIHIIVQGLERVEIVEPAPAGRFLAGRFTAIPTPDDWQPQTEAVHREVLSLAERILEHVDPQARAAFQQMVSGVESPLHQVYLLSSLLSLDLEREQQLLAATTQAESLSLMHEFLGRELQVLEVRRQIASQAQTEMSREQREYLLRKQMRAIQDELGEQSAEQADIAELRDRIHQVELPAAVAKEAERELKRLERLPTAAPDYQLTRSYLELIAELPWTKQSQDQLDLKRAREILDADHYGLEDVKDRIIEHLAVLKLNPQAKAPILCFVGPPGVGKTSLGQSIARSLGREFLRLSLGGVSDESELRGHRRTYIGAMPGRIIQGLRRAGVRNPLMMLDEVDKLGRDFRGDPAAALLEILDPAQNVEFRDNYLDLAFDLSQVFFIATANSLDTIPGPLLDRLEIIRLAGYSDDEKLHIAERYLIPRRLQQTGLSDHQLIFPPAVIHYLIRGYTREAGVRELERVIGTVCRKMAAQVAEGRQPAKELTVEQVTDLLGADRFQDVVTRATLAPGVAAGLAWTPVGGDVLYVEAVMLPEGKDFVLTGQLGDVMQESARTARSLIHSRWAELDISRQALSSSVHLHVPAGAVKKDGPSAGVTMAIALASLYTCLPVDALTAMTGEITLSGLVLPVGGIKEKILAAHRAGMRRVILPHQNRSDLRQVPQSVRDSMEFIFVKEIDDALRYAIPKLESRLEQV
ncbi:MAG: endopeptidase La [Pirellulales bacterium]